MENIKAILLITRSQHPLAEATAREIGQWLQARGVSCSILSAEASTEELLSASQGVQAAIILGGDGTFVGVSRKLTGLDMPLLGINFGRLGFLAELESSNWAPALEKLLAGELQSSPRSVLGWTIVRSCEEGEQTVGTGHAANDIVLGRSSMARILPVQVSVDGKDLGCIRGDGIIVSSPSGSSGYALSAHGPLVHPDVQAIILTPVSPFGHCYPPIVLPLSSRVSLQALSDDGFLTIDGQEGTPVQRGDEVRILGIERGFLLLSANRNNYYSRLQNRGFMGNPKYPGA